MPELEWFLCQESVTPKRGPFLFLSSPRACPHQVFARLHLHVQALLISHGCKIQTRWDVCAVITPSACRVDIVWDESLFCLSCSDTVWRRRMKSLHCNTNKRYFRCRKSASVTRKGLSTRSEELGSVSLEKQQLLQTHSAVAVWEALVLAASLWLAKDLQKMFLICSNRHTRA